MARNYCVGNPVVKTADAKEIEGTVGILTVAETARLLEAADAELVPFIAIGAFAGLRRAELERLDWSEVDLESGLITVQADKSEKCPAPICEDTAEPSDVVGAIRCASWRCDAWQLPQDA